MPWIPAGINNQIEEFWYTAQLALLTGHGLVLPAVAENVTWDDPSMHRSEGLQWSRGSGAWRAMGRDTQIEASISCGGWGYRKGSGLIMGHRGGRCLGQWSY